jgi:hypothetical protein
MAIEGVKAGCLGINYNFMHGGAVPPPLAGPQCIYGNNSRPTAIDERTSRWRYRRNALANKEYR